MKIMVTYRNLKVEQKAYNILNGHFRDKFFEHNSEYEGSHITMTQLLLFAFRRIYGEDYERFDENGKWNGE